MGEYGNEEIQDDNEEIEEEQELDKTISNNKEINLEDFEPINNQNIELDGESFEPSYNIETDIHEYQFEISNNLTIENSYKEFEPIHDEKNVLACNAPDIDNSWIQSIVNDPTLTTNEKLEKLEKSKRKVSKNSELSGIEKKKISSAIDDAITKLSKGLVFTSSIPSNRDATGKNNTSFSKDSQNSIDNKINNQEKFQSEQSERHDQSGINNDRNDSFHPYKEVRLNLSQRIGNISELSLIRDLERNGKNVSIPYGDFQRYDLLIEEEGNIYRVQVKTANKKDRFPTYSISKGQSKSYKGEIEYFGVYSQNENKSYLIPIEEINDLKTVKLDDSIKERYEIKYKNFNRKNEEKTKGLINESIQLTEEGKIILSQLGRRDENTIIYDDIMTLNNMSHLHSIHELKKGNKGKYNEVNIEAPNQIEIARANVAADLMSNGFIISTPVRKTNYDFIIEQKYGKEQLKSEKGLYKVKIFDRKSLNIKNDNKNENLDYFGIYDDEKDKSYLISTQNFNSALRNYENSEIIRSDNVLDVMTAADLGDAAEMRIGAEFMKNGFNVLHPIVGRPPLDLVVKKDNKFYTIEVKTGRTHYEKDSTYIRFDIASQESENRRRRSYKGKVDFIATVNQDNLKSYIVPVNNLPNNDAKLKLDERKDMRQKHHGTLWAKDYEFSKVDNIVQDFNRMKTKEKEVEQKNQEIKKLSGKKRELVEYNQILDVLKGSKKIRDISSINTVFAKHVNQFKKLSPNNKIEYQGFLSVSFRDFLISQPDLKPFINDHLKDKGLYAKGERKHQIIYDFFDSFYYENKRGPNTLELYRTFLNFKSHELRGKMNIIRKNYPHYYAR